MSLVESKRMDAFTGYERPRIEKDRYRKNVMGLMGKRRSVYSAHIYRPLPCFACFTAINVLPLSSVQTIGRHACAMPAPA